MSADTLMLGFKLISWYISIGLGAAIAMYLIAEKMGEKVKELEPQVLLLALIAIMLIWPYSIYRIIKDYWRK